MTIELGKFRSTQKLLTNFQLKNVIFVIGTQFSNIDKVFLFKNINV